MARDEPVAERLRQRLARRKGIREKKMFGVGFLLNGNLCLGVWKESLVVRLGPKQADDALTGPHILPFAIRGRVMKGWVLVSPEGVEDDDKLDDWIDRAVKFVGTLPAK
jgi:hypothetical protein